MRKSCHRNLSHFSAVIMQPERVEKEPLAQGTVVKLHPRAYSTLQRSIKVGFSLFYLSCCLISNFFYP